MLFRSAGAAGRRNAGLAAIGVGLGATVAVEPLSGHAPVWAAQCRRQAHAGAAHTWADHGVGVQSAVGAGLGPHAQRGLAAEDAQAVTVAAAIRCTHAWTAGLGIERHAACTGRATITAGTAAVVNGHRQAGRRAVGLVRVLEAADAGHQQAPPQDAALVNHG